MSTIGTKKVITMNGNKGATSKSARTFLTTHARAELIEGCSSAVTTRHRFDASLDRHSNTFHGEENGAALARPYHPDLPTKLTSNRSVKSSW